MWEGEVGGPEPVHRPCGPRYFGFIPPCLFSIPERSGSIQGQRGTALPFPFHPNSKGCNTIPASPLLPMCGGSGLGTPFQLGGGCPMEREDGRASHPKSRPYVGPDILLPGLWREGSFQRLPPLVKNVNLLNSSLDPDYTGGGHTLDGVPRIGQGVHLWGCCHLPPSAAVGWFHHTNELHTDG